MLSAEVINELIERFDRTSAEMILRSSGFPAGQIPGGADLQQFWTNVNALIAGGLIASPIPVITEALRLRPYNKVFRRALTRATESKAPYIDETTERLDSDKSSHEAGVANNDRLRLLFGSPTEQAGVSRGIILKLMLKLRQDQLNSVIFLIEMPAHLRPADALALADRRFQVLTWAESTGPGGLAQLHSVIVQILDSE